MTTSNNTLIRLFAAVAVGLFAAPAAVMAAPSADEADDVSEDDDDDCDDDDDDCDAEGTVKGGCSATLAPDLGQSVGGLLCTLGLVGWQLRRRRAA